MNPNQVEWVSLPPDSLCGTEGELRHVVQRRVFAGCFDANGEPVFETQSLRPHVPVVRPFPGQRFEGLWLPDTPESFVVLETSHLCLAFECPAIELPPRSMGDSLWLSLEAVEGPGRAQGSRAVWMVRSLRRVDQPAVGEPLAGTLRVPLADAIAYVAEERSWLTRQRQGLLPQPEMELSPTTARETACLDVLGRDYFRVKTEQILFEEVLRGLDSGQLNPRITLAPSFSRAEVVAALEQKAPLYAQMAELSRHPKLQPAIQQRADWILPKGRALESRLAYLEQLHANLIAQAAKVGQTLGTGLTPTNAGGALAHCTGEPGLRSSDPEVKCSAKIQPPQPIRPRRRF